MPLWVAYLVVFVSSACTLVLELVAGRILAPFIGVSLYTWTSIIGVVLAGISVGNYFGGLIADRWPRRRTLGVLLAAGGIASLAILPLIGIATVIPTSALVDAGNKLGGVSVDRALALILRIVIITTLIFLPPSLVLGMTSPVVIKLVLSDLTHTGGVVGRIYAVSTLGSIVGTFATGFYLVQAFGTRVIVAVVGVILLAMAVAFGDLFRARRALAPLVVAAVVVGLLVPARNVVAYGCLDEQWAANRADCFSQSAGEGWSQALDAGCLRETSYYCIKVQDDPEITERNVKKLVLDHLIHSYNALDDPSFLQYGYIQIYAEIADYLAARLPARDPRLMYVGGGGYTLPRHIEATYPEARQEVIEIDPGVTQTVYERLGLDPGMTKIRSYNFDARLVLNQLVRETPGAYDMIIGDAFNDLSIPYHLTTREFAQMVRQLLKDDGYYVVLVIDKIQGGKFSTAYASTLRSVWPEVYILGETGGWQGSTAGTYVIVAGQKPLDEARLRQVKGRGPQGRLTTNIMPQAQMEEWLAASNAPILTDDYAPVDNLIAPIFAERGF